MRKTVIFIIFILSVVSNYAQKVAQKIGVNPTMINSSAVLEVESTTKGLLFPRMTTAQRDVILSPAIGLSIYNTSTNCLEYYNGTIWLSPCAFQNSILTQIGNEGDSSNLVPSVVTTDQLTSIGITGVIASNQAAYRAYIDANPDSFSSPATIAEVQAMVTALSISIPSTITLAQNTSYFVVSIYDQDYLPYSLPTAAASTAASAANGATETTVNVQGSIPTTGIAIKIPVTATASGTLPAYSATITIPASMTEDIADRNLTLSWSSQTYTSATTTINATITPVGGALNAKKLDINKGVGGDFLGILMGQFTYPYNNAGNTTILSVRDIAAIPDIMFGVADNSGSSTSHLMLYSPIMAEDGKIWLNNNLGAHYANINHASFNPSQQATSVTDYLAYGSLFQWGRKADGHELITYTSSTAGTPVNNTTTTTPNNIPTDALFITGNDWRATQDDSLWNPGSAYNPCPSGFRVPTQTEQASLVAAARITNVSTSASSTLKFTAVGNRAISDGSLANLSSFGHYWSSSPVIGFTSAYLTKFDSSVSSLNNFRSYGFSVRCIKN